MTRKWSYRRWFLCSAESAVSFDMLTFGTAEPWIPAFAGMTGDNYEFAPGNGDVRSGAPGEIVRECCLKPLGLTVTAAAEALGVTRKALSDLLNGHSGVSPEMAIRLEKAGWSTAHHWLRMQLQRDLWEARQRASAIKVKKRFRSSVPSAT
jgi:addiction module HigA family antidote